MLETLRIQDYALIDQLELDFRQGFNVLTGETGAGKSILVGALNLVLGARASGDLVRSGADRASIEAVFRITTPSRSLKKLLKEHDIALDDDELLLSRTINAEGRSRGYAGGAMVPIAVLAAIGDELVDLHGQHEHQSLLKADKQLDLLDAFGGTEEKAEELASRVSQWRQAMREREALEGDDREQARQMEFLRFEVKEIDAAALSAEEEDDLKQRQHRITHAETIYQSANQIYQQLYEGEEDSAVDRIGTALASLEELSAIDAATFQALTEQLAAARDTVEAVAQEIRGFSEEVEYDPAELEQINQRLALIGDLKRKYGASLAEVLAYREEAARKLENFEQKDERLEALRKEEAAALDAAKKKAAALSKKRTQAAKKLDKQVAAALQDLGMKGARFETQLDTIDLTAHGVDRVEFGLAANAGEALKPLRQVASGGEISRIMLALKSVFASADKIPALIFDEIDAGVGGEVARKVAAKLHELSQSHQVLCITHLPQIAAVADAHYQVTKSTTNGRTHTHVLPLDDTAKIEELARLLDGTVSEASLKHARALLAERQ